MPKKFNVDHFIQKFESIPPRLWFVGDFHDPLHPERRCALGHCRKWSRVCGMTMATNEQYALVDLFCDRLGVYPWVVNDNDTDVMPREVWKVVSKRKTPRGRILAALRLIKRKEEAAR